MRSVRTAIVLFALGCALPPEAPTPSLEGLWSTSGLMSGADMQISADGSLVFSYAGCLDRGEFRARGVVQGRILVLDKPVHNYLGEPFSKFHYRTVGDCEFLVAGPRRETFDRWVREREAGEDARTLDSTYTLRRIPPKPVLEDLLLRCEDPEEQERLFEDWDKHALATGDASFLVRLVDSPAHVELRGSAISAMVHIGYDGLGHEIPEGPARAAREDSRSKFLKMLRDHPEAEVRRLVADRLTDDANLTDWAAFAESDLRRSWKEDPDERVRLQSALGLGILKCKEVAPFLLERMPHLARKEERRDTLLALAVLDAADAVELFEKEIKKGELGWRTQYVEALGRLKSVRSVNVLVEVVRKTEQRWDKATAMEALKEIGAYPPEVRAVLLELMRSKTDWLYRVKAAEILSAMAPGPDPEAVAAIRMVAKEAGTDHWREVALEAARELERKPTPPR